MSHPPAGNTVGLGLTITVDQEAAAQLAIAATDGRRSLPAGEMSVAITPNLVPGEPFEVSALEVVITDDLAGR